MKSDIEIAQEVEMVNISEIANSLGIDEKFVNQYGKYKAKIDHRILKTLDKKEDAKVVLVTAISPTPAGEGKTTTTVGLGDSLQAIGKKTVVCLREPSLGPVFGVKGGAAGGGYAQVVPMEDINLHFTGDLHAIGVANNLMAALIDNHIHHGNALRIDNRRITWRRAVDMNDRQLRSMVNGLGGKANGTPREDGFDITVASEIMAVFCLSSNLVELKENLAKMVVAYTFDGEPVYCGDLNAQGALAALLKEAFDPNLVQTLEKTPAFIHGGPFANIAHGCNSVIATKLGMKVADIVVTEAGFGADLGAEKFLDIKCRKSGIAPSAVVLVATIRALKHQGGCPKENYGVENLEYLKVGLSNLERHIDNVMNVYNLPVCVAINKFPTDTDAEYALIKETCEKLGAKVEVSDVFSKGSKGGEALANTVVEMLDNDAKFNFVYDENDGIETKLEKVAKKVYRANGVVLSAAAKKSIKQIEELGYKHLPICIAKNQYSFTDDQKKLGAPTDFDFSIREVTLNAGAGFIVCVSGSIMRMPGLPKVPSAEKIDVSEDGIITGLF